MSYLISHPRCIQVVFDQREHVLLPPAVTPGKDERLRKRTRIFTTTPSMSGLERKCSGDHSHVVVQGSMSVGGESIKLSLLGQERIRSFCVTIGYKVLLNIS